MAVPINFKRRSVSYNTIGCTVEQVRALLHVLTEQVAIKIVKEKATSLVNQYCATPAAYLKINRGGGVGWCGYHSVTPAKVAMGQWLNSKEVQAKLTSMLPKEEIYTEESSALKLSTLGRGQGLFAINTKGLSCIKRASLLGFLFGLGYKTTESIDDMLYLSGKHFPFVYADSEGYLFTVEDIPAKFIALYKYDLEDLPNFKEIELKNAKAVACYFPHVYPEHLGYLIKLVSGYKVKTIGRSIEQLVYNLITQPLLVVTTLNDGTYRIETKPILGPSVQKASEKYGAKLLKNLQEVLDFINQVNV